MYVPPRHNLSTSYWTAVAWAAVLALIFLAEAILPSDAFGQEKRPISLAVWLYHFPGESSFLAELAGSYKRNYGRPVRLYTHDWAESTTKLKEWTGNWRQYAPDMVIVRDVDLPLVAGHLESLEQRFPVSFLRQFYPGLLAQGRIEGVLMSLPWMVGPQALYYRADVLREKGLAPPRTPEELLQVAREVADPPAMYGLGLPGRPDGGAADMFLTTFRAHGGVLFDAEGNLAINSDPGRQALQWWCELAGARATQPEVLTWTDAELADLFTAGRLAMLIDRPWLLRQLKNSPLDFEVGVVPVPKIEGGCDHLRADGIAIFDTAGDVEACLQFIRYALGAEQQRTLARLGVPSVRKDAASSLPRDKRWEAFKAALRTGRVPSPSTWAEIARIFNNLVFLAVSGHATVEEAMDTINVQLVDTPETGKPLYPAPSRHEDLRPREKAE